MRSQTLLVVATVFFSAGCSSTGSPDAPAPAPVLGFRLPSVPSATYHVADTSTAEVDSPMGRMEMGQSVAIQLDMTFEDGPDGVRVTGNVAALDATAKQPMGQPPLTLGVDDVEGPLVFMLDGRGVADVVSVPATSGVAAQLASFNERARGIFPRLPNRAAVAGDSWVDTVTWSANEGEADVTSTTVYNYTAVGDTVVDGRSLLGISVTAEGQTETKAVQQGMQVDFVLSTSESGLVLWDLERALLYASEVDRTATGTVEVAGTGMPPMSMEMSGRVQVRLANDAGGSQ